MKKIAVIDHSMNGLFIYNVNEKLTSEEIECFLRQQGRNISDCSWGEFDGEIIDLTEE